MVQHPLHHGLSTGRLSHLPVCSGGTVLPGLSRGEEIQQHPSLLTVREGGSFVINCTYTDSASDYFFWYKQEPGKGLQLLIYTLSNVVKKQEQRLTVLFNKKDKHLSLQDTATHPRDSATYFCATRAQWSPGTCSLPPNLRLEWKPHSFSLCHQPSSQRFCHIPS
uniref:Ig-like domain-containing protein n=1 Tax=Mustela putorius furo TaxID=9669 RepID=M3Y803_MUSPF